MGGCWAGSGFLAEGEGPQQREEWARPTGLRVLFRGVPRPRRRPYQPPQAAPDAWQVGGVQAPGDDALQAALAAGRQERGTRAGERCRGDEMVPPDPQGGEPLPADAEGLREQRDAGQPGQVADDEGGRRDRGAGAPAQAPSQGRPSKTAGGVGHDQLPVEDRAQRCRPGQGGHDLCEGRRHLARPDDQPRALGSHVRQRPRSSPVGVEKVTPVRGQFPRRTGEHRAQVDRRTSGLGRELQRQLVGVGCGHEVSIRGGLPSPRPMSSPPPAERHAPAQVRISPDGSTVVFTLRSIAPARDGYRHTLWLGPSDGSRPARQLTLGRKSDAAPRWSPDGRTLAFISDRAGVLQACGAGEKPGRAEAPKEGAAQVWLLPMEGGEARQLTRLPRDVSDLAWSADGARLCVVSAATSLVTKPERAPDSPPESDIRQIDRLMYMDNATGFTYDRPGRLWRVDAATGEAVRLTRGAASDGQPRWSPDGTPIVFVSSRHRAADLTWQQDLYAVPAEGGRVVRITGGRREQYFESPAWSPDGAWIAAIGHRFPARAGSRGDVWRYRPVAGDAGENLTADADLFADAHLNSDLLGAGGSPVPWSGDGRWVTFSAPIDSSYELWRVEAATKRFERLTEDRHFLYGVDQATLGDRSLRVAAARTTGTTPPDVYVGEAPPGPLPKGATVQLRRLTDLMGEAWKEIELVEPRSRWHEVAGRRIQGWFLPAPGTAPGKASPLVVEIHGGPATLYGWSLMWEWQCLVGGGISVYACNPRGSQGYGQDFCAANFGDWGTGPMADVMGGVD